MALSSRNAYLTAAERKQALALSSLETARRFLARRKQSSQLIRIAQEVLSGYDTKLEYLELRTARDLSTVDTIDEARLILIAAHLGTTRLIDNVELIPA